MIYNIFIFIMFYQIFLLRQVKRWMIITYEPGMYELPDELPNDLKVQSCKLCNNKYMIPSTQIINTEILASIVDPAPKPPSHKAPPISRNMTAPPTPRIPGNQEIPAKCPRTISESSYNDSPASSPPAK